MNVDGPGEPAARALLLASGSPRRLALLRQIGVEPRCRPVGVDETPLPAETPWQLVERLAHAKAGAACPIAGELALGADTVIDLDGAILGKPRDRGDFLATMRALSGREHRVLSGVAALAPGHCSLAALDRTIVVATTIRFAELSRGEAEAYWASGEPVDKAGGYAIQGLGARFVAALNGSYSNVVGLPLYETSRLLAEASVSGARGG